MRGSSPECGNKPFLVADDGSKAHLQRLNAIMSSDMDWCVMSMISLLAQEAELIGSWCEGCPCHLPVRHEVSAGPYQHRDVGDVELIPLMDSVPCVRPRRRKPLTKSDRDALACCFRCCRAPELATGCALLLQRRFMAEHKARFNSIASKLPNQQRGDLVGSWNHCCAKIYGL